MTKILGKLVLLTAIVFAGIVPAHTIYDHIPIQVSKAIIREIRCMELNLHHEARGESMEGVKTVANVTLNRTKSRLFPSTVCGVVSQPNQFSWFKPAALRSTIKVDQKLRQIAFESILSSDWKDNTDGALFFHNDTVEKFNRPFIKKVGGHSLYR